MTDVSDTLNLSVHHPGEQADVVAVAGDLDLHTAPTPHTRAPWPSSNRASRHLVLALTHIDRVDSTGLSTLITLLYATREAGGSLRLARIPGAASCAWWP
ncbi:STAS domain-containing protein [Streptomyces sp. NPDC040750]|uniref:STAS domain-containing protein n=1 Tax=Streptomyces sp. NPDC040750 TaxID=3154491 RepID=UPI0033D1C41F